MSNLIDQIGGKNLFGGTKYSFCKDRFESPESAICFQNGYLQIPEGVYFAGDFTICAWVKLNKARHFARIIEFGNGAYADNVELSVYSSSNYIHMKTWFKTNTKGFLVSGTPLELNRWTHIASVLNGGKAKIYFNGVQVAEGSQYLPRNVSRNINSIGIGNFPGDESADAYYDEIKIFNRALDEYEINDEADIDDGK